MALSWLRVPAVKSAPTFAASWPSLAVRTFRLAVFSSGVFLLQNPLLNSYQRNTKSRNPCYNQTGAGLTAARSVRQRTGHPRLSPASRPEPIWLREGPLFDIFILVSPVTRLPSGESGRGWRPLPRAPCPVPNQQYTRHSAIRSAIIPKPTESDAKESRIIPTELVRFHRSKPPTHPLDR